LLFPETPTLTELAESVDKALFQRIMHNPYHVPQNGANVYNNIKPRHHNRQLKTIAGQLRKLNFILPCVI